MAIKVEIHYPTTPEAIKEMYTSQARAVVSFLQQKMNPIELDKLFKKLSEQNQIDK